MAENKWGFAYKWAMKDVGNPIGRETMGRTFLYIYLGIYTEKSNENVDEYAKNPRYFNGNLEDGKRFCSRKNWTLKSHLFIRTIFVDVFL